MTPTDPELVTRLREHEEQCVQPWAREIFKQAADALDAARQREEALARAIRDASPSAANRPPSRETTVTLVSDLRGDTQSLVDQIGAAEAPVQQLEAALQALITKWSDAAGWEYDDMSNAQAAQTFDQCAADLEELLAGRADTPEPEHES